jgi:hypothetical protein
VSPIVGELTIVVPTANALPDLTREELNKVLTEHGAAIVHEAGLLAADPTGGNLNAMITPIMVRDAHTWKIKGFNKKRRSKKAHVTTGALFFLAYVGGIFTNNITKPWGSIGFAVCAAVAVVVFMWGGRDE